LLDTNVGREEKDDRADDAMMTGERDVVSGWPGSRRDE
jgi:hypothetical protein